MSTISRVTPQIGATAIAWQDVEDLLNEITQLAKSELASEEFATTIAGHALTTLQAAEVALWLKAGDASWNCVAYASKVSRPGPDRPAPHAFSQDPLVALGPFTIVPGHTGIIEVVFSANQQDLAESLPVGSIEAMAEILADFYRGAKLSELGTVATQWAKLSEITASFHADLDCDAVAYRIANESRNWLQADRVSVLLRRSSSVQLLAVSGVDAVDARADVVRTLVALTSAVERQGELFWKEGVEDSLPPEIESRLHDFLEHSPAKCLAIVPLSRPINANADLTRNTPAGFLVTENFSGDVSLDSLRTRLSLIRPHAASSIANAWQHQSVPGAIWFDRITQGNPRWLLNRVAVFGLACVVVTLALIIIPADFKIEARGELQPVVRREVYAPLDGVINENFARHGESVSENAVLLKLAQPELDLETARVEGELQTARKRLAAAQAARRDRSRGRETPAEKSHQATADEEELKETVKSLQRQQQILALEREQLLVRSPLAGKVLTWNVESLLAARPVARGQQLLTVADTNGPWQLELEIADDRMGFLMDAREGQQEPLPLSFVVATDPGSVYHAHVSDIAQSVDRPASDIPKVKVIANLGNEKVSDLRPGAEVIAQIHCGRKSLGYVWFHDVVDAIRGWLFF